MAKGKQKKSKKFVPLLDRQYVAPKEQMKCDSNGIPLSHYTDMAEEKQKTKRNMDVGIERLIDLHVTGNVMVELEVVVAAVTDYIKTENGEVIPAEVSLVRLTLRDGVDRHPYHAILNPPSIWPLGVGHMMRTHVKLTHCLPTDRTRCVGTDSFSEVATEVTAFLEKVGKVYEQSGHLCPVFTPEEHLDSTRTVFSDSLKLSGVDVWSLEHLLCAAREALGQRKYSVPEARGVLFNSPHVSSYHPSLGCKWHREEQPDEVNFCSLNMAQRWGFLLLHALNVDKSLGVQLVAGRHWPVEGRVMQSPSTKSPKLVPASGSGASSREPFAAATEPQKEESWQDLEKTTKTPALQNTAEFPTMSNTKRSSNKAKGSSRPRSPNNLKDVAASLYRGAERGGRHGTRGKGRGRKS